MVSYQHSQMMFGGSDAPCAFIALMSLGNLGSDVNSGISNTLMQLVQQRLGVPSNRCYIQFYDSPRSDFGFNGGTF
ncbi:unnamed protein product [Phaeothamnion confervicola]